MSSHDSAIRKSKIPRFQGTSKKVRDPKTTLASSGLIAPNPRQGKTVELKNQRDVAQNSDSNCMLQDIGEVLFEPDQRALASILNNEGIVPEVAVKANGTTPKSGKISSVFNHRPSSRMSMWESHLEFKKNVQLYKEKMQQFPQTKGTPQSKNQPGDSVDIGPSVTPGTGTRSSIYYQPSANRTSLIESYQEHKQNMKIFREKMQHLNSALQTPKGPDCRLTGGISHKKERPGHCVNTTKTSSAITPKNANTFCSRRPWTEFKENRVPAAKERQQVSLSASKAKGSRMTPKQALDSENDTHPSFSTSKVRKQLLSAIHESEEMDKAPTHTFEESSPTQSPQFESVSDKHSVPHTSCMNTIVTAVKESVSAASCEVLSIACPPMSKLPSGNISIASVSQSGSGTQILHRDSTKCTWSSQGAVCTPTETGKSIPKFPKHKSGNQTSDFSAIPSSLAFTFPSAPDSSITPVTHSTSHRTEQTVTSSLTIPKILSFESPLSTSSSAVAQPPLFDSLTGKFDKLTLFPSEILPANIQPDRVSQTQSHIMPFLLKQQGQIPAITRANTMYAPSPLPSRLKEVTTPVSASRIRIGNQASPVGAVRTPVTPMTSYLTRPPARTPAFSSCLKNKNKNGVPARNAVSAAKKLRWADSPEWRS